jgi:AraC-like DNA-binding protein
MIHVTRGNALVSMALAEVRLNADDEVFMLPHTPLEVISKSADFEVEMLCFDEHLYQEARHNLPPQLEMHLRQHSIHHHQAGDIHFEKFRSFMSMGHTIAQEQDNAHRQLMQTAFLKIYLLYLLDKCQHRWQTSDAATSSLLVERFYQFIDLLERHCRREYQVAFYASAMAITPRYLNMIVHEGSGGSSAKDLIDRRRLLEVKSLLRHTTMTQQQIALALHFPDVSYLGRFFKRHTGMTLSAYRQQ